ncbi:MAG TPA: hypothetical protein VFT49_04180 [Candidatus Saccharimonadales bacterium]|nr:hypothetical protein [Candidatus Saccharimonadales bacterium]
MGMHIKLKDKLSGFTTIELLIVIVLIVILGSLVLVTHNGVEERNRDTERKSDIVKLEAQIETYQAETDKYPSVKQMDSASFRSQNMKELDVSSLTDPLWKSSNSSCTSSGQVQLQASATPSKGCYGYDPSPAGCDNDHTDCTSYMLTANLETGGSYIKASVK